MTPLEPIPLQSAVREGTKSFSGLSWGPVYSKQCWGQDPSVETARLCRDDESARSLIRSASLPWEVSIFILALQVETQGQGG